MLFLALQLAGMVACVVAGVLAGRRSLRLATALSAGALVLILLKVVCAYLPAVEPRVFAFDLYPYLESWWYALPGMILAGAGWTVVRASMLKRDLLLVAAGVLLLRTLAVGWAIMVPHALTGVVEVDGRCVQTSGYSCAPAAAAALLHRCGVLATEAEMAELCVTRGRGREAGTSDSGILRGLRRKLGPGRAVRIAALGYDSLRAPSIVAVELPGGIGHALMVDEVGPEGVRVMDPLMGYRRIARAPFERMWQKQSIWVD